MSEQLKSGVYHRSISSVRPDPPAPDRTQLQNAKTVVSKWHQPTPLVFSHSLSDQAGRNVYLKLEGTSAIRSFKYRGALVAVAKVAADTPGTTIVTASTGNHGQGIAFAGRRYGLEVIVCSPVTTLTEKRLAMEALGAHVVIVGETLTDSERRAREIASDAGGFYLEDGESSELMMGAATVVSEMLDQEPRLDSLVIPVGGGNLIAASLLAAADSSAKVTGVQSVQASGATASWLAGEIVQRPCTTFAGGLATERPGELSLSVMEQMLETMVLVDDQDLRYETGAVFSSLGLAIEGAAAAPFSALRKHPDSIPGSHVGLVVTGSWLSLEQLEEGLALVAAQDANE